MAMTLDAIMAGLNSSGYDAQRASINTQIAALPGQQAADQAGLDATKAQAFQGITNTANARGMTYSGMPLNEQASYLGSKYLPAVAQLKNTYANNTSKLQGALGTLNANEYSDAQKTLSAQQTADANAAAKAQSTQLAEERLAISASRASAPKQPSVAEQKAAAQTQLNQDLTSAFNGYGARPKYYTENTIIPELTRAYPELNPTDITKAAYAYRKAIGFN